MRRFLFAITLAALAASLLSVSAVSAESRVKARSSFISCSLALSQPSALAGDTVVRLVRAESQAVTPDNTSAELVRRVVGIHKVGCGSALNYYVHRRVTGSADDWYDDLLLYLGL